MRQSGEFSYLPWRSWRPWRFNVFLIVFLGFLAPLARGAEEGHYAKQLRAECDALIESAVRRPYGWGWGEVSGSGKAEKGERGAGGGAGAPAPNKALPAIVSMEPLGTPAAGLVLLWSGDLLNEPGYREAALNAARGIVASQDASGRIPSHPIFGPHAGGREELALVPSRTSTCASLGLLLTLQDRADKSPTISEPSDPPTTEGTTVTTTTATSLPATNPSDDRAEAPEVIDEPSRELFVRSNTRAVRWLLKQQSRAGAWPSSEPLDAAPGAGDRIIRLDNSDYRDSTFTLLLAGEVTNDKLAASAVDRAVDQLLKMRLDDRARFGEGLWVSAYQFNAFPDEKSKVAPFGVSVTASRCAILTLFAHYLSTGDRRSGVAMDEAGKMLTALRRPDGLWEMYYDFTSGKPVATTQPTTQGSYFPTSQPALSEIFPTGTYGLDDTIRAIAELKLMGAERYKTILGSQFGFHEQLAQAVTGLNDSPLTLELPATVEEAQTFVKSHAALWKTIEGDPPTDLGGRVQRAWVLLLRARLERMLSSK